jgi:hypothetical protein
MRPEYEEFEVRRGKEHCLECYNKQLQIEKKLWEEEQRREIGPDWIDIPTRKIIAFKKPISVSSCSSFCGGDGPPAATKSDNIPRDDAKGYFLYFISPSFPNLTRANICCSA